MTPLKLFFVRHGESAGNIDKRKHLELADHAIPLRIGVRVDFSKKTFRKNTLTLVSFFKEKSCHS